MIIFWSMVFSLENGPCSFFAGISVRKSDKNDLTDDIIGKNIMKNVVRF